MNRAIFAVAFSLLVTFPLSVRPARAARVSGVELPESVRVEGRLLRLNGMALYRKLVFPVLVGGLYLSAPEQDAARILAADSPRRYVSHFLRDVGPERICDAWRDGLEKNSPLAGEEVREQFRALCGWMREFHDGDEITVTYLPDRGSIVEINGAPLGTMKGKAFADAYFSLALGPKPSLGKKFKARLLAR